MAPPAEGSPSRADSGGGLKEALTRKIGPLPTWAWAGIAVGGIFLYKWYKNRQAANTSTTTPATAPATTNGQLPYYQAPTSGGGSSSGGGMGGFLRDWNRGQQGNPPTGRTAPVPALPPAPAPVAATPSLGSTASLNEPLIASILGPSSSLTPTQLQGLSMLEQPQNQPASNPFVSSTPVTVAPSNTVPGGPSLPPASGVGTRYVTPGTPYAFTYG